MQPKRTATPQQPGMPFAASPEPGEPPASDPLGGATNYVMAVAYDGSRFQGWQVQPHGPSVQGRLEEALWTVTGAPVKLYGSGRTDAGVHAFNQIANFRGDPALDLRKLRQSLNALAAPAISVKRILPVSAAFHARHSAIGKTYRYHIFNRPYPSPFAKERCWWIRAPLDVPSMAEGARELLGTHDFSAFRSADCAAKSPVRTMRRLELRAAESSDRTLTIEMEASGFLQHMARIIAGTLIAVGMGRLAPDEVGKILKGKNRRQADMTAPGRGLHLVLVRYDLDEFPEMARLVSGEEA